MKSKITLTIFIVLLAVGLISSASYHGSFNVNVGTGSIVIDPGMCEEDWSSSFWSECVNNIQTFICIQTNPHCNEEYLKPKLCGQTRECDIPSETTEGGNTGGGGSNSGRNNNDVFLSTDLTGSENNEQIECVERWMCGEWSDSENSCGTRICTDKKQCNTYNLKPETFRKCPSQGVAGIKGSVIGGITNFAKSQTGFVFIFVILIAIAFILVVISKNRVKVK